MVIKLSGVIKKIQRGKIIRHKYQATDNKTMGYVAQISYLLKILSLYKKIQFLMTTTSVLGPCT